MSFGWKNTVEPKVARPQNKHFVKNIATVWIPAVAFYTKFNGWKNTMKFRQNIYDEIMTKHLRWSFDKTYTMKFRQNMYEEVMTKHIRWRSHDKTYTKKSWQIIYVHYDEEVMTKHIRSCLTKHIRWNHDKTFTLITMKKSWKFKTLWVSPLSGWG